MTHAIFKDYYKYPNNWYLNWDDWNCLYDFAYANQNRLHSRTHLFTSIETIRNFIKCKVGLCGEITWHQSKLTFGTKKIKLK